jgi:translation initiation factor 2 alpha subunit (eIF-2alpha)
MMNQYFQDFAAPLQELERVIPPVVADFLRKNQNLMLVLERDPQTDKVQVGVKKIYNQEAKELVAEVHQSFLAEKRAGYSRKDAAKDFLEAQDEIAKQIEKNEKYSPSSEAI